MTKGNKVCAFHHGFMACALKTLQRGNEICKPGFFIYQLSVSVTSLFIHVFCIAAVNLHVWILLHLPSALTTEHNVISKHHSPWRFLFKQTCQTVHEHSQQRSLMTSHHQIEPRHMISLHLPIHDVAASVLFHSLLELNHIVSQKCLLSLAFTTPLYRHLRCYPEHRKWIYPISPLKTAPITTVTSKDILRHFIFHFPELLFFIL